MSSHSSRKGVITEQLVIIELLKNGFSVSVPVVDEKYDLIAEKNGIFCRIQCKTARQSGPDSFIFRTSQSIPLKKETATYFGHIDFFATRFNEECYFIPIETCKNKDSQTLRLDNKKPQKRTKSASDYSLEKFINTFK